MRYVELKKWFKNYLEYRYAHHLEKIEMKDLGNNAIFKIELNLPKTTIWYSSENKKTYYLILDLKEIKDIDAIYVFLFNQKSINYILEHPEIIEKKKVLLINPKSLLEKVYPIHKRFIEKLKPEFIRAFFNKIKNYIDLME